MYALCTRGQKLGARSCERTHTVLYICVQRFGSVVLCSTFPFISSLPLFPDFRPPFFLRCPYFFQFARLCSVAWNSQGRKSLRSPVPACAVKLNPRGQQLPLTQPNPMEKFAPARIPFRGLRPLIPDMTICTEPSSWPVTVQLRKRV